MTQCSPIPSCCESKGVCGLVWKFTGKPQHWHWWWRTTCFGLNGAILGYSVYPMSRQSLFDELRNRLWKSSSMFHVRFVCWMSHSIELMWYSRSRRPVWILCFIIAQRVCVSLIAERLTEILWHPGLVRRCCWSFTSCFSVVWSQHQAPMLEAGCFFPLYTWDREGWFFICTESACQWNDLM